MASLIYKVGLLGASGRMGLEIGALLMNGHSESGFHFELGDAVAGSHRLTYLEGVPVRMLSEPAWQPVHLWVDFSRPEATCALLEIVETPLVICTTGFDEKQLGQIDEYATRYPVLLASNTSPGMSAMQAMLRLMTAERGNRFDVVVNETHHKGKKDSPGGTTKTLMKLLTELGYPDLQVQVARAGGEKGTHSVRFIGTDEELRIEHRVFDRAVFARGALRAAAFLLKQKKPRVYTMDEVFSPTCEREER